ncbi:hypothetical protein F7734_13995 [Scytonema sp. UIC 10036]|uniref:hypothetical protein n=1 Tax=Scytonema sp. UIC 10036 TaxID=2304196 RepID=UPI00137D42C6|nr:hypothetical protein [Scytonema sp. UIC 10036]MUG93480.1 hypothetical protein [Scytonema sp. UIC 10036]
MTVKNRNPLTVKRNLETKCDRLTIPFNLSNKLGAGHLNKVSSTKQSELNLMQLYFCHTSLTAQELAAQIRCIQKEILEGQNS